MPNEQPGYRVYTVIERENEEPFWLNLGLAFPHKDGHGFNVLLNALPLDGKLVIRQQDETQGGGRTARSGGKAGPGGLSSVQTRRAGSTPAFSFGARRGRPCISTATDSTDHLS
ncbi:MAG TPA: hypothetical protein VF601_15475 [Beijerinckiaceae bacterium]